MQNYENSSEERGTEGKFSKKCCPRLCMQTLMVTTVSTLLQCTQVGTAAEARIFLHWVQLSHTGALVRLLFLDFFFLTERKGRLSPGES